jgi:anti-anti-sigma regulatory factor
VLLDFGPVNFIDITASDELLSLIKELRSRGITLAPVCATLSEMICGLLG